MTESNQQPFFPTQINQYHQKNSTQSLQNNNIQQQSQNKDQQPLTQTLLSEEIQLKKLLQLFNSYDKLEKGLITEHQCLKIIDSFDHIPKMSLQKVDTYFKLSLSTNEGLLTFDEFLFVFGLCEFDIDSKSIDQQYDYCKAADQRIIDFLRLLNSYRKKCEKESVYFEAKKSKNKVEEVREKQFKRRKNYLSIIHKKQLLFLQNQQKQKFVQFCQTWDEFMNEYEQTAAELVKKLSEKQDQELKELIKTTKQGLRSKVRFSKKVVDLQDLERRMVKSQQYEKAEKIKIEIEQQKVFELQKKQKEDMSTVELRVQTLRKQQTAAMNSLLQKVQKDRNDQSKQRTSDSQKLIVKSKTLVTEVKHRHTEALKKLYEALHNITIDQNRLHLQQTRNKSGSSFSQTFKQKV